MKLDNLPTLTLEAYARLAWAGAKRHDASTPEGIAWRKVSNAFYTELLRRQRAELEAMQAKLTLAATREREQA